MATPGSAAGGGSREGSAKAMVADQISQAVQSTSNLLHLMQQSSPAQAQLIKLPKNLLAKVPIIKNTEQILEQMPGVISSLDAHMEHGLQNIPHLKTVTQLLANMESCQLNSLSQTRPLQKELEPGNQPQGTAVFPLGVRLEKAVDTNDIVPKSQIVNLIQRIVKLGYLG